MTMSANVSKDEWVELFRDTGLSEEMMQTWHQLFEQRHPEGHQDFLSWLGLPAPEIDAIRRQSR